MENLIHDTLCECDARVKLTLEVHNMKATQEVDSQTHIRERMSEWRGNPPNQIQAEEILTRKFLSRRQNCVSSRTKRVRGNSFN